MFKPNFYQIIVTSPVRKLHTASFPTLERAAEAALSFCRENYAAFDFYCITFQSIHNDWTCTSDSFNFPLENFPLDSIYKELDEENEWYLKRSLH